MLLGFLAVGGEGGGGALLGGGEVGWELVGWGGGVRVGCVVG